MARIVFCGAQNTGKTSVAVPVSYKTGLKLVTGFARNSPYAETNLNQGSHSLNQIYLTTAIATATSVPNTISDRCPIDSHAYTIWSYQNNDMYERDYEIRANDKVWLDEFVGRAMKNYDLVVYFPAFDWPIESDGGVRSLDKTYRLRIDQIMYDMLSQFCPNGYKTMPDVPLKARLAIMQDWLLELGIEFN